MTVHADPAGFAVDWDWQRGLTVWALAGRRFEPRFDRKVLEHELPAWPVSERRAQVAARRWWRTRGRAEAFGAVKASAGQPAR
ncbi:MAG: hypothetical protein ACRDPY_47745 [Streptosporangiaceae bacterium]